jgi:glycosyltransferase involved in cell wall biosynthesis
MLEEIEPYPFWKLFNGTGDSASLMMKHLLFLSQGVVSSLQGGSGVFNHYLLRHLYCQDDLSYSAVFAVSSVWWNSYDCTLDFDPCFQDGLASTFSSNKNHAYLFIDNPALLGAIPISAKEISDLRKLVKILGPLASWQGVLARYLFLRSFPRITSCNVLIHADWSWTVLASYLNLNGIAIIGDPPNDVAWDRVTCHFSYLRREPSISSLRQIAIDIRSFLRLDFATRKSLRLITGNRPYALDSPSHLALATLCPYHSMQYKARGFNFAVIPWFSPSGPKLAPTVTSSSIQSADTLRILHLGDLRSSASLSSIYQLVAIIRYLTNYSQDIALDIEFLMVGHSSHAAERLLRGEASSIAGIKINFLGICPDLYSIMESSDIMIAPMNKRSGIRTRVLTAFGSGLPVVAHSSCSFNIPYAIDGCHWLLASTPSQFSSAIIKLSLLPGLRRRLASNALDLWQSQFSPSKNVKTLIGLFTR